MRTSLMWEPLLHQQLILDLQHQDHQLVVQRQEIMLNTSPLLIILLLVAIMVQLLLEIQDMRAILDTILQIIHLLIFTYTGYIFYMLTHQYF